MNDQENAAIEKTARQMLEDVGQPFLDRIGWTESDTREFIEFMKEI